MSKCLASSLSGVLGKLPRMKMTTISGKVNLQRKKRFLEDPHRHEQLSIDKKIHVLYYKDLFKG